MKALMLLASMSTAATAFTIHTPHTHPLLSTGKATADDTSTALYISKRGRPRGPVRTIEVKPTMNGEITHDTLRVTVPQPPAKNGKILKDEPLGIMSKVDALAKAKELGGLDLILINEISDPPVAKIVDYSKFRYEKIRKAKELKKNSKTSEVKEIKMSYKIDKHDYGVRIKNASKFIKQGNRVRCTIQFKGREVQHDKLGFELINKIAEEMTKICVLEGKPKREGRNLSAILSPRPEVTKAVNDKKRADDKAKKRQKKAKKEAKSGGDKLAAAAAQVPKPSATAIKVDDDDDDLNNTSLDDLLGEAAGVTDDLFN
jgi:translation initiation factor IF-3